MFNNQKGVAIVEFAMVLPLLLLLTFITTEYGRAIYQYNVLTKSVRDAVRYLSPQTPWLPANSGLPANAAIILRAKNLVVYGNPAGTGSPIVLGLTVEHVSNPIWQPIAAVAATTPPSTVNANSVSIQIGDVAGGTVATRYTFIPLFASVFGITFRNMTYGPIRASMRAPLG